MSIFEELMLRTGRASAYNADAASLECCIRVARAMRRNSEWHCARVRNNVCANECLDRYRSAIQAGQSYSPCLECSIVRKFMGGGTQCCQ